MHKNPRAQEPRMASSSAPGFAGQVKGGTSELPVQGLGRAGLQARRPGVPTGLEPQRCLWGRLWWRWLSQPVLGCSQAQSRKSISRRALVGPQGAEQRC